MLICDLIELAIRLYFCADCSARRVRPSTADRSSVPAAMTIFGQNRIFGRKDTGVPLRVGWRREIHLWPVATLTVSGIAPNSDYWLASARSETSRQIS
jgi:hypothetical protein